MKQPAKCSLGKIDRFTEVPAWPMIVHKGGYTVHPVPAPLSTIPPVNTIVLEREEVVRTYYLSVGAIFNSTIRWYKSVTKTTN
jgi:hypothetical protein